MKKLLISLLVITFALFFVGCGETTTNEDGSVSGKDWQEIQSITYCLQEGKETTLTSSYKWEYTDLEYITEEEFSNAPTELRNPFFYYSQNLTINKDNLPENPSQYFNKPCYFSNYDSHNRYLYTKCTITGFSIRYVKIHLLSDNKFEINHFDGTQFITETILPQSYKITHFTK